MRRYFVVFSIFALVFASCGFFEDGSSGYVSNDGQSEQSMPDAFGNDNVKHDFSGNSNEGDLISDIAVANGQQSGSWGPESSNSGFQQDNKEQHFKGYKEDLGDIWGGK